MGVKLKVNTLALRDLALFQGLGGAELADIGAAARQRSYEKDAFLFFQGDPVEQLFVLLSGKIKLSAQSPDGRQVMLRIVSPVDAFSVVAALERTDYPVTAQAAESSTVLAWQRSDMQTLMLKHPRIALNALGMLAERTREFQKRLLELSTERVERRIARTLIRLARQAGRKTAEGVLIDLPLSRQDLAELCGTTLFTVSRTLSQWESRGLVRSKREQVLIVFPHGLVQIAEDLPVGKIPGRDPDRS